MNPTRCSSHVNCRSGTHCGVFFRVKLELQVSALPRLQTAPSLFFISQFEYHHWTRFINMDPFEYNANPGRVVFGSGSIQRLPAEIQRLKLTSPLLLSTPQQFDQAEVLAKILEGASMKPAGTYVRNLRMVTLFMSRHLLIASLRPMPPCTPLRVSPRRPSTIRARARQTAS